jgi:hypothetical protein
MECVAHEENVMNIVMVASVASMTFVKNVTIRHVTPLEKCVFFLQWTKGVR